MKFKKFKRPVATPSIEQRTQKTIEKHLDFFTKIKESYSDSDYEEWACEAAFLLRLDPSIDKNKLHPENIQEFIRKEVTKVDLFT